ncbi:hypothetical protein [Desertibaculum subflavum]|uniref:hypothetical protein n=1 Tax=Desertibaculum subflavum TaxID=2268458 RepID=UPI000E661D63
MRLGVAVAMLALVAGSALAADPPTSTVSVTRQGEQVTVKIRNVTYALTGEIVSPRARRERLLLRLDATTTEVMGEKGIEGNVRVTALPLDGKPDALFEIAERGRHAAIDEEGLIAIDLDDCCSFERAYSSPWTGELLFQASTPPAWIEIGREFRTHRVAAFRAATDDLIAAGALPGKAVGLITYAAADRVIRRIVIEAPDEKRGRELRSIWDEQFALAWIDAATGLPLPSDVAARAGTQAALRLLFVQANVDLRIPLVDDDLRVDRIADGGGLTFTPLPSMPVAGTWRVVGGVTAPWASGTMPTPMIGRHVVFGLAAVRSGTVLDCARARYEVRNMPPEGLFQGGLAPERAAAQATRLGLPAGEIATVLLTCDAGLFDFHLGPGGKALFALDNVIYTLDRVLP